MRTLLQSLVVVAICASLTRADWITEAYFSPDAGIDSLERFIVIEDDQPRSYFGWHIIPLGDANDDGIDDVLIGRWSSDKPELDDHAFVHFGGSPPDTTRDGVITSLENPRDFQNIGDVNGDGYDDLGVSSGIMMMFAIYFGGPLLDDTADFIIDGIWCVDIPRAADLDGDGHLDLALHDDPNDGCCVSIYRIDEERDTIPEHVIADTSYGFGHRVVVGYFNGDSFADLAVGAYWRNDSNFVKFYWGGPTFDTIPDYVLWRQSAFFGRLLEPIGDINADGSDDLLISGNGNEPYGVFYCGPDMDDSLDLAVNQRGSIYVPAEDGCSIGDFNDDGYPDFAWSYNNSVAFIHEIYVYLGGPDVDDQVDILLDVYSMPSGQDRLGWHMSGVGDFDGDGISDFAAQSRKDNPDPLESGWISEVNFFAGWHDPGVDVPFTYEPSLPSGFLLRQNYPNPFNMTTTIVLEVPVVSQVSVKVYNVIGQEVVTLIDSQLSPGNYTIQWDARNKVGQTVSSGLYLCELHTSSTRQTTKMLLLK